MQSKVKGAFGKFQGIRNVKINRSKLPNTKMQSMKKRTSKLFQRRKSSADMYGSLSELLAGTWEMEIPSDIWNASTTALKPDDANAATSTPDTVTEDSPMPIQPSPAPNYMPLPLLQIAEGDLKVSLLPLNEDISSNERLKEFLSNAMRLESSDGVGIVVTSEDNNTIQLIDRSASTQQNGVSGGGDSNESDSKTDSNSNINAASNVILEGEIDRIEYAIKWSDGTEWHKLSMGDKDEPNTSQNAEMHDSIPETENSASKGGAYADLTREQLAAKLTETTNRVRTLTDKQDFIKQQGQGTMTQLADLSRKYTDLDTAHKALKEKYSESTNRLEAAELEKQTMNEYLAETSDKLNAAKKQIQTVEDSIIYKKVEETQLNLSKLKDENARLNEQLSAQQEQILSLSDQLQHSQMAARQHIKTIQELESRKSRQERDNTDVQSALTDVNEKLIEHQNKLDEERHSKELLGQRYEEKMSALKTSHGLDMQQLERGFQETLSNNERKIQELQGMRNSYVKKNASLAKDVRRLISQLENQTSKIATSPAASTSFADTGDDVTEETAKLRNENARLSEELIRKSQSLVDALRALADIHSKEEAKVTERITRQLSAADRFQHFGNAPQRTPPYHGYEHSSSDQHYLPNSGTEFTTQSNSQYSQDDISPHMQSFDEVSDQVHHHMEEVEMNQMEDGSIQGSTDGSRRLSIRKQKLLEMRGKIGTKWKNVKEKTAETKKKIANARGHVSSPGSAQTGKFPRHNPRITRQHLTSQTTALQSLANELTNTVEQKEQILHSLRFANTYLGKRVIALERLLHMDPGALIPHQEELVEEALQSPPAETMSHATYESTTLASAAAEEEEEQKGKGAYLLNNVDTKMEHDTPVILEDKASESPQHMEEVDTGPKEEEEPDADEEAPPATDTDIDTAAAAVDDGGNEQEDNVMDIE